MPDIHTVSLPPEDYPAQKDYAELILTLNAQSSSLHGAFLYDQLEIAQSEAANLFDTAAELLKLASVLLIERHNHVQINRTKDRLVASTVKGEIRAATTNVSATAEKYRQRDIDKDL